MKNFRDWIAELEVDVIQGEYGYEPGEFSVFPERWRPLYREGHTPSQAFRRALNAFAEERKAKELERQKNWERIQAEDQAAIEAQRGTPNQGAEP